MSKSFRIQENVYNTFLKLKSRKKQQQFLEKCFIYAWENREIETDYDVELAFCGVKPSIKLSNNGGGLNNPTGINGTKPLKDKEIDMSDSGQSEVSVGSDSGQSLISNKYISNKNISNEDIKEEISKEENNADANLINRFIERWNKGIGKSTAPSIKLLSDQRRQKLKHRLEQATKLTNEPDPVEAFFDILNRAYSNSSFLRGETNCSFKITLDFLLQESKFIKLAEGGYDDKQ